MLESYTELTHAASHRDAVCVPHAYNKPVEEKFDCLNCFRNVFSGYEC